MRGCLFTIALGVVAVVFAVVVGLPAVAAGVLTAGVRAAGLQASDLTVSVSSDPPTGLLGLKADRVRVRATNATFRGLQIGALDVTLLDVALLDRSVGGVAGRLTGVTVPNVAGQPLGLAAITLGGSGGAATASTTITAADAQALVAAEIASSAGVTVPASAVRLMAPDKVSVKAGPTLTATLQVDGSGNLVAVVPGIAPAMLLRAGEDVPMRLTSVRVTPAGELVLTGELTVGLLG